MRHHHHQQNHGCCRRCPHPPSPAPPPAQLDQSSDAPNSRRMELREQVAQVKVASPVAVGSPKQTDSELEDSELELVSLKRSLKRKRGWRKRKSLESPESEEEKEPQKSKRLRGEEVEEVNKEDTMAAAAAALQTTTTTTVDQLPALSVDSPSRESDTDPDLEQQAAGRRNRHRHHQVRNAPLSSEELDRLSGLIQIIREGSYSELLELLESRQELKGLLNVFYGGHTALHYALLYRRSLAWSKQLILNGANPNLSNLAGWHPVHLAAYNGCRETLLYLIDCLDLGGHHQGERDSGFGSPSPPSPP